MPGCVRAAVAAWAVVLVAWALVLPPMTGEDEAAHVDMAVLLTHQRHWPSPGQRQVAAPVEAAAGAGSVDQPRAAGTEDEPWRVALGGQQAASSVPNQQVQHPPTWYAVLAPVAWVGERTGMSVGRIDLLMRLLGVLLLLPLPIVCWAVTRRFLALAGQPVQWAPLGAAAPLLVGGVARGTATVTNDAPLTTVAAVAVLLLLRFAGSGRLRDGLQAGAVCGACALLKGTGLALVPVAGAVGLLVLPQLSLRRRLTGAAAALGAAALISAPWWLRNLIVLGTPQPRGLTTAQTAAAFGGAPHQSFASFASSWLYTIDATTWSGQPPEWDQDITRVATVLAGLALLLALVTLRRRRRLVLLATLPLLAVLVPVAHEAVWHWQRYGGGAAAQGRYLFVGLAGGAALLTVVLHRVAGTLRLSPGWLTVGVVALLQGAMLARALERWWAPAGARLSVAPGRWAADLDPVVLACADVLLGAVLALTRMLRDRPASPASGALALRSAA